MKKELRRKYNIAQESYLVGSFQRDTEGADLKSPKLSKGLIVITIVKVLSKEFQRSCSCREKKGICSQTIKTGKK